MTYPNLVLSGMAIFIALLAGLCLDVLDRLTAIFTANPFFNGVILAVLLAGVVINATEVFKLSHELLWVGFWRAAGRKKSTPRRRPSLLAAIARWLPDPERIVALPPATVHTLLEGVQSRLEEARSVSRYLMGLAIFLGLLGTFWGLLVTIQSVTGIIATLDVGEDAIGNFVRLKNDLSQPLAGMATSFSTSLFGLASSLIIGFLDLLAGQVQTRFYLSLEEWLTGLALPSRQDGRAEASGRAYLEALLTQTAEGLEQMQAAILEYDKTRREGVRQFGEFARQLARLNELMDQTLKEQQSSQILQQELKTVLQFLANQEQQIRVWPDELRTELRLLTRTLALALESRLPHP
jgi:hypothetical protein